MKQNNKIKLSIIIPYYQTYDLTSRLLDVLKQQITPDVEIIVVDDGCNELRLDQYTFANIIHLPENKGASTAYNMGIEQASGQYIGFIDSDDMISPDYVDTLVTVIQNHNEEEILFGWEDTYSHRQILKPMNIAVWKAIYRADFCPRFNETWKYRTDVPFNRQIKARIHRKYFIPKILYYYNSNREGSLTWNRLHEEQPWHMPEL